MVEEEEEEEEEEGGGEPDDRKSRISWSSGLTDDKSKGAETPTSGNIVDDIYFKPGRESLDGDYRGLASFVGSSPMLASCLGKKRKKKGLGREGHRG